MNEEKTIYLKDLLFTALYGWRAVLTVMLALAMGLGAYKTASRMGAGSTGVTESQIQQYLIEKSAKEQLLKHANDTVQSHQAYMDGSMLMRLDPYGYYEAVLSIYVKASQQNSSTQTADTEDSILGAYRAVLQEDTTLQEAAKLLQIDSRYVAELITVTVDSVSNTLEMTVKCTDPAVAEALAALLTTRAEQARAKVQTAVARHNLQILKQDVIGRVDPKLVEQQKLETDRLEELKIALNEARIAYATVQMPDGKGVSLGDALRSGAVFAVLGSLLGLVLTVCVLFVRHIGSNKIYSARTLRNRTGVKILARVSVPVGSPVDLFLRRAEGRATGDAAAALTLAAADIRLRCGEIRKLLITGGADAEGLAQALQAQMPNLQITVGDILTDPAALEGLQSCDAVVLAEACGLSAYSDVELRRELAADYEKQLLGCVLIGG